MLYRQLLVMETQIHLDPLNAYKELESMKMDILSHPPRVQYIYYLRKAQAENFLYLFDDFEVSIRHGKNIVDDKLSSRVSIWYQIYQCLIYQRNNNYEAARECYESSVDAAKQNGNIKALVFALQEYAYAESLNESYLAALDHLQTAHRYATNSQDPFLMGLVRESYGAVYGYLDDYENSITHYQQALNIYEELGFKTYMAEAHYGLASTYRYWGKLDLALSHYMKFSAIFEQNEDTHHRFLALYGLGMTYAAGGQCTEAMAAINEAVEFSGLDDYRAELFKKMALCLVEMDDIKGARQALARARELLDRIPELEGTTWQLETLKIEATIMSAENRHDEAFALMNQFHEAYLERHEAQASSRLSSMRINMESQRKDLEIEQLKQERLRDEVELEKQRQKNEIQKYITIIWIIIAFTFVFFIVLQRRNMQKFKRLSFHDPLTQLYNRRYILDLLHRLIAKTSMGKMQLSLILMDIDDFKQVNDSLGHSVGDKVLCALARVCLDELRHTDSIGRIGGEEFLVILPREGEEQIHVIAERLRQAIEKTAVMTDGNERVNFTVSMGIARLDEACADGKALLERADQALYKAKELGKNRVCEFT